MDEKWHEKFGMEADPAISGIGDTLERVIASQSTLELLHGYIGAVRERTVAHLSTVSPADLDREILLPRGDLRPVRFRSAEEENAPEPKDLID